MATGAWHTCSIDSIHRLKCWGRCSDGQCDGRVIQEGNSISGNMDNVGRVSGTAGAVVKITAGWLHSCSLGGNGECQCFGSNEEGQVDVPVAVDQLNNNAYDGSIQTSESDL